MFTFHSIGFPELFLGAIVVVGITVWLTNRSNTGVNSGGNHQAPGVLPTGLQKFCTSCGVPMRLEDVFCGACGTRRR